MFAGKRISYAISPLGYSKALEVEHLAFSLGQNTNVPIQVDPASSLPIPIYAGSHADFQILGYVENRGSELVLQITPWNGVLISIPFDQLKIVNSTYDTITIQIPKTEEAFARFTLPRGWTYLNLTLEELLIQ
jgi:hypothetical protein